MSVLSHAGKMQIIADRLSKRFSSTRIFNNISFDLDPGKCLVVTGANGSGKTTLIRILAGLERPSSGSIQYNLLPDNKSVENEQVRNYISLVGPYLELYQDLTALENLLFFAKMWDMQNGGEYIGELLTRVGLKGNEHKQVKTFSSGMKQRLKYAFALLRKPLILLVDEPRSNLDQNGIDMAYQLLQEQKRDRFLILATNDQEDLQFGDISISL